jgi:hypothetical protein
MAFVTEIVLDAYNHTMQPSFLLLAIKPGGSCYGFRSKNLNEGIEVLIFFDGGKIMVHGFKATGLAMLKLALIIPDRTKGKQTLEVWLRVQL